MQMDMQVKVLFKWSNLNKEFIKEAKLFDKANNFSGIEIAEFDKVEVIYECNDPNARLEIERFDSDEFITLVPGESVVLTKKGDSDDMLVPGDYPFRVKTSTGVYECLYRILPKNISWEDLINLRKYLEKILSGLSYNLYKKRAGLYIGESAENYFTVFEIYKTVKNHYVKLKRVLDDLFKNPLTEIVKEYKLSPCSKKPDNKSQRWLAKKGVTRNMNILTPALVYEKHAVLTVDTFENRWLKHKLKFIQYILRYLENCFYEGVKFLQKEYDELLNKKTIEEKNYEIYSKKRVIFSKAQYKTKKILDAINEKLEIKKDELKKAKDNLVEVQRMGYTFSRYENESWLKDVGVCKTTKPSLKLLKDYRYASFYRFYREITKIQKQDASSREQYFPHKKTSLLYEYYILCLLIKIIEENGFKWEKGWLADKKNPLLGIGILPSGEILEFKKGKYTLELAYDTEITQQYKWDISQFMHFTSICRPDYRLSIFQPDGKVHSLIVDAKYRKFHNLYNKMGDTDVMEQLKKYIDIKYYCKNKKDADNVVKKVVGVYPRDENAKTVMEPFPNRITLLQVHPVNPDTQELPFGYENLSALILEFINSCIEETGGAAS